MKHIHTFESFLNEERSSNLNERMSFEEIRDKYENNPYGIGAQSIEFVKGENGNPSMIIFRHDERSRRDQIESKLKSLGIPAKKLSKSTADKAYKYRYELNMYESALDESHYAFLGGNSNFTDDEMRKNVVEPVLGKKYDAYIMFDDSAPKGEYDKMKAKYAKNSDSWENIWRSDSYQSYASISQDIKVIKAAVFAKGGIVGAIYVKK
jgi:uncharacterized protein YxeA